MIGKRRYEAVAIAAAMGRRVRLRSLDPGAVRPKQRTAVSERLDFYDFKEPTRDETPSLGRHIS